MRLLEIIEERLITLSELKEILEEREDELDILQRRVLDYAKKFTKIDAKKARELYDKLVSKYRLEKREAIQIINSMPKSIEELRVFLMTERRHIYTASELEEILKALDEYRK